MNIKKSPASRIDCTDYIAGLAAKEKEEKWILCKQRNHNG
jgi:hypothetical protein